MNLVLILQLIVAIGLLNVWLLRSKKSTEYRGKAASNLKEEFLAYGLPVWFFYLIGALKIGAALALIAGVWMPELLPFASGLVIVLMLGALSMHIKVKDPIKKSLPAALMLIMSAGIFFLQS